MCFNLKLLRETYDKDTHDENDIKHDKNDPSDKC